MKKLLTLIMTLVLSIGCLASLTACGDTANDTDAKIKGYSGEVVGVDIYLMAKVCEELDMKMQVEDVDFNGIVGSVKTKNDAVGAAGITITDERKDSVDFSNAYYSSVQFIISKSSEGFTSLEDLAGKKIGVQKGTTGALMVDEAINGSFDKDGNKIAAGILEDTDAEVLEYATGAVAFTAMKTGKCDYVVIDELPAQKLVSGNAEYVAKAIEGIEIEEYGFCVSKTSTLNAKVLAAMNKVIAESDISNIVAYYTALSSGETSPADIDVVNLSDNKGATLVVYTCSGFEPYEFTID